MSRFSLAISCLTTSNLPWFKDLTFQVPMQYCSFQRWTLLLPPDMSTTEHHFCFGSVSSFFLELLVITLCSSAVAYWIHFGLGAYLPVSYLFAFSYSSWGSHSCVFPLLRSYEYIKGTQSKWILMWEMSRESFELVNESHTVKSRPEMHHMVKSRRTWVLDVKALFEPQQE